VIRDRTHGRRELFGHPLGLYILFFTEMWERFCFYGMRALLVLYVAGHLARPDVAPRVPGFLDIRQALVHVFGPLDDEQLADQIYGIYTACVYLTPFFGGILADRVLGQRRSVVFGGVIMAVGEFMLTRESLFYPALVVLIVGNGFFKSNISTQVGALYPPGDPRRDRAFNIFYVGINLGAWLSPLVCGTLGQKVGWAWGFGSAGVGMVIGLAVYAWGQRYLAPDEQMRRAASPQAPRKAVQVRVRSLTALERAAPQVRVRSLAALEHAAPQVRVRSLAALEHAAPLSRAEWARILALIVLCALNVAFWGVYEQQGSSLQFWADRSSDRHVLRWLGSSWEMPSTWFQSVNPTFIMLCTPGVNALWRRQARAGTEPSSVTKMAVGCFLLGVSFLVMIGAGRIVDSGHLAGMGWLVGCSLLLTVGEIYLSPVGLSLVTKIAPARIVSMMMGMWFLSSFFGNYVSGYLATYAKRMSGSAFFAMLGGIALATGILMLALRPPLKRAIGDENGAA
jgi:POT family proton-dependent oligopeptide transporter